MRSVGRRSGNGLAPSGSAAADTVWQRVKLQFVKQFVPTTALGHALAANRSALLAAAAGRRAQNVRVFGSVARGDTAEHSDVDLLVTLDREASLLDLIGFQCDAEDILGVKVDVGTPEGLRPHVRDEVLADAAKL